MTNLNERNCAYCGKVFSLEYADRFGYKSILNTTYCSKSCATSDVRGIDKDSLQAKALNFIKDRKEYCTKEEICKGTGHSSKTFHKHGLNFSDFNREAGFDAPKSKFQNKVGEILNEEFTNIESEKKFDGLVGIKGHPLRVDFYIPEINTVVEADGSQHSDPKHPWREWNNGTVAGYDEMKNQYFKQNGIALVRIPYKRNLKKEDILSRLN